MPSTAAQNTKHLPPTVRNCLFRSSSGLPIIPVHPDNRRKKGGYVSTVAQNPNGNTHPPTHRQELLDQPVLLRAPPDHRVILLRQHEPDRHHPEAVGHPHRRPPRRALVHFPPREAQHSRHARAADVHVQQSHLCSRGGAWCEARCGAWRKRI